MEQGEFFGLPKPDPRQQAEGRAAWGGAKSRNARAIVRAQLPACCWRCGKLISPDDPESSWHAGHVTDRAAGGEDSSGNYAPECSACNLSAGGKVGAAITNANRAHQRQQPFIPRERAPQWW